MIDEQLLQAIKDLAEKATPGPWQYSRSDSTVTYTDNFFKEVNHIHHGAIVMHEDGEFIAKARQHVPELVAEIEYLREMIAKERKENLLKIFDLIGSNNKKMYEENKRLREALETFVANEFLDISDTARHIARKALAGESND